MKLRNLAGVSACALLLSSTLPALAAEPTADAKKAEAAQRFDRGLELFDDGDNAGALAEFKRTYELFPNPVVLYNIGLVYAAMRRPVDAVDALEKVVNAGLSGDQKTRADQTLADQKARIGRLMVTSKPEGARIEIDNVEVAKTPLTAPLRISEGSHIVGAVAEGFTPTRKEIVVAGNSDAAVNLELVSSEGKQLANLTVRSRIVGADVHVDGEPAGKTPLATSITLVAGHHVVELKRPGYSSQRREVDVGAGATGELSFELAVDPSQLGSEGATLAIDASEASPVVFVDEESKGAYSAPLRLPKGPHRLRIERGGFLPVEREVNLEPGQTNLIHAEFEPTPETRASYESSAGFHRTWGWIGIISGALVAGGGGAWLAVNAGPKKDALDDLNTILDARDAKTDFAGSPGDDCNTRSGGSADVCNALVEGYQTDYDNVKGKDVVGFIGIGVGGALLVTGVVLLVTGDDPDRYEHPPSRTLGRTPGPSIALAPGPGDLGGGLQIAF